MTAAEKLNFTGSVRMSNAEYHAHEAIGSTSLKHILRSPAHYIYEKQNPTEPTAAMQFGTAAHEALLEPNQFTKNAVVMPKFEGTGSRAAKEQWLLENHGKTIVKADDMADILGMLKSISAHKTARSLLTGGAAEGSYFWQDEKSGLACKCRPDFLRSGNIVVDVKTTNDASTSSFERDILNFKYHLQAAHYLSGVTAVTGNTFDTFLIIAVEKTAPYGVQVFDIDRASIDKGLELRDRALATLKQCIETGIYPGYSDSIIPASIPPWGLAD